VHSEGSFVFLLRLLTEEPLPVRRVYLEPGAYTVGSLPESDVPIPAKGVSRRHARLDITADGFATLTDLGSRNGTFLGGSRVDSAEVPAHRLFSFGSVSAELVPLEPFSSREAIEEQVASSESGAVWIASPEKRWARVGASLDERAAAAAGVVLGLLSSGALRREEAALRLAREWLTILPAQRMEWLDPDDEGSGMVLAASAHSAGLPASGQRLVFEGPSGMRLHLWSDQAEALERCRPLFLLTLEALLLAGSPRSSSRDAHAVQLALDLPAPGSMHPATIEVYRQTAKVAVGDLPLLLVGESGTGKETLARWIHARSPRSRRPFVAVQCAASSPEVAADLFGFEGGGEHGADAVAGAFERANGGTVLLHDVGSLPPDLQVRLLKLLEERVLVRGGGRRAIAVDVRVLSASPIDLEAAAANGAFRTDLYYRLAGFAVRLPALRDRQADIPILGAHFFHREVARQGKRSAGITRAALATLVAYGWPGNVAQLESEIAKAVLLLVDDEALDVQHLSSRLVGQNAGDPAEALTLAGALRRAERQAFEVALAAAAGDPTRAMALLELPRNTYERKLHELGLGGERAPAGAAASG
jgi:DNA-binding NtrC family response regulator